MVSGYTRGDDNCELRRNSLGRLLATRRARAGGYWQQEPLMLRRFQLIRGERIAHVSSMAPLRKYGWPSNRHIPSNSSPTLIRRQGKSC